MTHSNWNPRNNFSFYNLLFKTGVFNLKKVVLERTTDIVNFISELQCGETDK